MSADGSAKGLIGEYTGALDSTGRLTIPGTLRKAIPHQGLRLAPGMGRGGARYLVLCSEEAFDRYAGALFEGIDQTSHEQTALIRRFYSLTYATGLDGRGRLPIPEDLACFAGIERSIRILGAEDRVEIWAEGQLEDWREGQASIGDAFG